MTDKADIERARNAIVHEARQHGASEEQVLDLLRQLKRLSEEETPPNETTVISA